MHPQQYASLPRLFPVDLSARRVCPGTGVKFQAPARGEGKMLSSRARKEIERVSDDIIKIAAADDGSISGGSAGKRRVKYPLEGNPMCAIDDGGDAYVAFSQSGLLSDVGFTRVSFSLAEGMEEFEPTYQTSKPIPDVCNEDGQILQIVATNREAASSERGLIAARVRDAVFLGVFRDSFEEFKWVDRFAMESSCATCINELSMNEVAALDASALSVFDLEYGHPIAAPLDLQPLDTSSLYRWLRYGAHPRTLFLANASGVGFVDLRAMSAADGETNVLDPRNDWNLCKLDTGVCYFDKHPRQPFQSVLMTSSLLCIMDSRMLQQPLLEWNINCSEPYLSGAVAAVDSVENQNQECDIVIALASAPASDLWVLHASQGSGFAADLLTPSTAGAPGKRERSKHPRLLWSDMPLEQLDRFPERHEARGIALVPFPKEKRISLLQYSVQGGTIAQLLGCEPFQDGDHLFITPDKDNDQEEPCGLLVGMDSFASILNARDIAVTEPHVNGRGATAGRAINKHFEADFNPGWKMYQRLSRLDARDAQHLRKRVCREHDDGRGPLSRLHVPQGFCSDLIGTEPVDDG